MFKKYKLILVLICIFPLIFFSNVIGQDNSLEPNYVLKRDLYIETYQKYLASKEAYLNQKTLERKKILFEDLKNLLYSRNRLMHSYFGLTVDNIGNQLSEEEKNSLKGWQTWLDQNQRRIEQASTVEELYQRGSLLNQVYPEMEADTYFSLTKYAVGSQREVVEKINEIVIRLKRLTDEDDWADEIDEKISLAIQSQDEALNIINEIRARKRGDMKRAWSSALNYLDSAQENLNAGLEFIDEVIKRVE